MVEMGRHERAVARSLAFAQDAAAEGDFANAVGWLQVVQAVDGGLPPEWERTLTGWIDRKRAAELGCAPAIGSSQAPKPDRSGIRATDEGASRPGQLAPAISTAVVQELASTDGSRTDAGEDDPER
jgi:hypothetical protein